MLLRRTLLAPTAGITRARSRALAWRVGAVLQPARAYNMPPPPSGSHGGEPFGHPGEMLPPQRIQEFLDHANRNKVTKSEVVSELHSLLHASNRREVDFAMLQQRTKSAELALQKAAAGQGGPLSGLATFLRYGLYGALFYLLWQFSKDGFSNIGKDNELFKDNFQEFHPPPRGGISAATVGGSGKLKAPGAPALEEGEDSKLANLWKVKTPADAKAAHVGSFDIVTFDDVKGNADAKEELSDLVDYLRNPEKYEEFGLKIPKGVLLAGPPGTGKTLLARALAGEAEVPFINVNGSSFVQMFAGLGAQRVRRLFARARELSPCIIFIDEVDALGTRRDTPQNYSRQTLNQLLGEMDGFAESSGVIVIGATNLAHTLDPALTRPGRFDRTVQVTLPDKKVRREMLAHYLKKKGGKDVDLDLLSRNTTGMTGADLFQLVNRAGIEAVKKKQTCITQADLIESQETIIMGRASKDKVMSGLTKEMVAYHEAGHALLSLYTPGADPIYKATVLPRGGALGFVAHTPKEEFLKSKDAMLAHIDVCMGGRAAEELIFGKDKVTQGASNDFQQATRTAANMVARYGMSDGVGKVYHSDEDLKKLSPEELAKINGEVRRLLDESYERAMAVLKKHATQHKALAKALLAEETLSVEEIKKTIGFPAEPVTQS